MLIYLRRNCLALAIAVLGASLTGCQIGPTTLAVSNAQYSEAIRVANSEQLLVNLVRMRYRDLPVFLAVSNISTQFEFNISGDLSGTIIENVGVGPANTPDILGLSSSVGYSEKPTITFSVMGGESFQKRMLAPLRVVAISLLAESGWRVDRVLRLTVEEVNGLKNAPSASGPTPSRAPRFRRFLEFSRVLERLRRANAIKFEYVDRDRLISSPVPATAVGGDHVVAAAKVGLEFHATLDGQHRQLVLEERRLMMSFNPQFDDSPDVARLRELLRLKPGQSRFDWIPRKDSELDPFNPEQRIGQLAINTRSLMGVLYYVSNAVQPPQAHLEAGIVTTTLDDEGNPFDWSEVLADLFEVHSSKSRPTNAAVAVHHRGYWFYIADDDESSKSTFNLLNQVFTLQAGDVEVQKPVLTLPVGG